MFDAPDEKRTRLRYAGTCRVCGTPIGARTETTYERTTKTVRCLGCSPTNPTPPSVVEVRARRASKPSPVVVPVETPDPIDVGTPGVSARRDYERRRAKRETRIREKHPKLGGLILALSDEPQSTTAWNSGALGEERLGRRLSELSSDSFRVLHDRRIPGTQANIDHIAITPTGIYVIDAKRYVGKRPTLPVEGGVIRPRVERLMVGGRDQTKLVDGVLRQVDLVRSIVGVDTLVTGVLCFVEADWPLVGGAFTFRSVEVMWPGKLYARLAADGPLSSRVDDFHRNLAARLFSRMTLAPTLRIAAFSSNSTQLTFPEPMSAPNHVPVMRVDSDPGSVSPIDLREDDPASWGHGVVDTV